MSDEAAFRQNPDETPDEHARRLKREAASGTEADQIKAAFAAERLDGAVAELIRKVAPFDHYDVLNFFTSLTRDPADSNPVNVRGLVMRLAPNRGWWSLFAWHGNFTPFFQDEIIEIQLIETSWAPHYVPALPMVDKSPIQILVPHGQVPFFGGHGRTWAIPVSLIRRWWLLGRGGWSGVRRQNPLDEDMRELERKAAAGDKIAAKKLRLMRERIGEVRHRRPASERWNEIQSAMRLDDQQLSDVKSILAGRTPRGFAQRHQLPQHLERALRIYGPRGYETRLAMLDIAINGFGIEAIRDQNGDAIAEYVNTGDTYSMTFLLPSNENRIYVTSWGDWLEGYERRHGRTDGEDDEA